MLTFSSLQNASKAFVCTETVGEVHSVEESSGVCFAWVDSQSITVAAPDPARTYQCVSICNVYVNQDRCCRN